MRQQVSLSDGVRRRGLLEIGQLGGMFAELPFEVSQAALNAVEDGSVGIVSFLQDRRQPFQALLYVSDRATDGQDPLFVVLGEPGGCCVDAAVDETEPAGAEEVPVDERGKAVEQFVFS